MREIKYRAWDKELKKWSDIATRVRICDIPFMTDYEWCQYTGLKDKNGKEIYESDICIVRDYYVDEEDGYFKIEFDDDTARVVLNGKGLTLDFDNVYSNGCEVIGNVWENPELLESEE